MIVGGGVLGLVSLALWIYCIFDVISTEEWEIPQLPKAFWLLIVILVPAVGSLAWLILGRPPGKSFRLGSKGSPPARYRGRAVAGPEDSPEFLSSIEERKRLERWEDELRQREQELRRKEGESGNTGSPGPEAIE